jgi:hypothetical protein
VTEAERERERAENKNPEQRRVAQLVSNITKTNMRTKMSKISEISKKCKIIKKCKMSKEYRTKKIQWMPLIGITDNGINGLVGSNLAHLTSPK